jgi:hypothetical protein
MTSKYDRLADHLATRDAPAVTLTFAEVERIVGPLPAAARSSPGWWGATQWGRFMHVHTMHWFHTGWVADRPDFAAERVTFRRVAP